jgi:hypothetical protein
MGRLRRSLYVGSSTEYLSLLCLDAIVSVVLSKERMQLTMGRGPEIWPYHIELRARTLVNPLLVQLNTRSSAPISNHAHDTLS